MIIIVPSEYIRIEIAVRKKIVKYYIWTCLLHAVATDEIRFKYSR